MFRHGIDLNIGCLYNNYPRFSSAWELCSVYCRIRVEIDRAYIAFHNGLLDLETVDQVGPVLVLNTAKNGLVVVADNQVVLVCLTGWYDSANTSRRRTIVTR